MGWFGKNALLGLLVPGKGFRQGQQQLVTVDNRRVSKNRLTATGECWTRATPGSEARATPRARVAASRREVPRKRNRPGR